MTIPYILPVGEQASADYTILLGNKPAQAYSCRVSKVPYNTVWPGCQRPMDQTELASFISFDATRDGQPIIMDVECAWDFDDYAVRPKSAHVEHQRDGRKIHLSFPGPGQYTLEPGGEHGTLHIFVNPAASFDIRMDDPNLIYFGPGVHHPGRVALRSGSTVYIDRNAVVYGYIEETGLSNIRVCGYGILDNSMEIRTDKGPNHSCMQLTKCRNVTVEGIVFRNACSWTATCKACQNITFDRVKLIGMWRYNSDGIDLCNCQNAVIQNSFLRNFDDCIVLKGMPPHDNENVENIVVENCVLWCDWGRALEIGAETCAPYMRDMRFSNCDIIHTMHMAMDIQNSGFALVTDLIFENIRVEYSKYTRKPIYQRDLELSYIDDGVPYLPYLMFAEIRPFYRDRLAPGKPLGQNRNITFRDIAVLADEGLSMPPSLFRGDSPDSDTRDIHIHNLTFNGRKITTLEEANVSYGANASDAYID